MMASAIAVSKLSRWRRRVLKQSVTFPLGAP